MFQAKVKSETLKGIVDVVSTLVDEAKFNVNAKGVSLKAVDPAHVAMVDLKIDKSAFEEFAADDAMEARVLRHAVQLAEALLELPLAERLERLRAAAERRWKQKVHFAEVRLARLGWEEACHHTALEILGYRFNRAPMLVIQKPVRRAKPFQ